MIGLHFQETHIGITLSRSVTILIFQLFGIKNIPVLVLEQVLYTLETIHKIYRKQIFRSKTQRHWYKILPNQILY